MRPLFSWLIFLILKKLRVDKTTKAAKIQKVNKNIFLYFFKKEIVIMKIEIKIAINWGIKDADTIAKELGDKKACASEFSKKQKPISQIKEHKIFFLKFILN